MAKMIEKYMVENSKRGWGSSFLYECVEIPRELYRESFSEGDNVQYFKRLHKGGYYAEYSHTLIGTAKVIGVEFLGKQRMYKLDDVEGLWDIKYLGAIDPNEENK